MPRFHLDMDGVVADWVEGSNAVIGRRIDDPRVYCTDEEWARLKQEDRFFLSLPKLQNADKLVDIARRFRDELGYELVFLTAVPHKNDMHFVFYDKVLWAQKYYPDIPVHFGPYSGDKYKHCTGPKDILVDDRTDNCEMWRANHGIAVTVPFDRAHYNDAIVELEELFERTRLGTEEPKEARSAER